MLDIKMLNVYVYTFIILLKVYWLLITSCLLLIIYLVNKLEPLEAQVKMDSFVFHIIFAYKMQYFNILLNILS